MADLVVEQSLAQQAFADPAIMSVGLSRPVDQPSGLEPLNKQVEPERWISTPSHELNFAAIPVSSLDGSMDAPRSGSFALSQAHTGPSTVASPFQSESFFQGAGGGHYVNSPRELSYQEHWHLRQRFTQLAVRNAYR